MSIITEDLVLSKILEKLDKKYKTKILNYMQLNYRLDGFSMLKRVPDKRLKIALKNDNNALELFLKCVCYFYFVDESQTNIGTFVKDEKNIDDLEYLLDEQKVYSKIAGYLALYYLFDDIENHDVDNLINFNTADEKQISEVNLEENIAEEEPTMEEIYDDNNGVEETNTMYFGYIKVVSSLNSTKDFYNFFPTHYLKNGELEEIADPSYLFPDRGNILFSMKNWRSDDLERLFSDNTCCFADIRDEDLNENRHSVTNQLNSTNYKVYFDDIAHRVFTPREKGFFYIVEPTQKGELDFSKNIEVKGFDFSDRDDCLLLYRDCLVGPFNVKLNQKTGNYEIDISTENNFIFDCYRYKTAYIETAHIENSFLNIKNGYSADGDLNVRMVKIDDRFARDEHDYITDKALLDKLERLLEIYSQSGESIDSLDIDRIKKIYIDSPLYVKGNAQLSEDRFNRITYILDNWKLSSETVKEVTNITEKLLMVACNSNDSAFSEVVNILVGNEDVIREIPKHQAIKESTEQLLVEAEALRKEIEELEKDKESIKQEEIEKIKKESDDLEKKRQQLTSEIEELERNHFDLENYDGLSKKLTKLNDDIKEQEAIYENLIKKTGKLQDSIIKSVNASFNSENISISIADAIKNDMLSQAIIDATATVAKEKDNLQYEKRIKAINAYGHCNKLCGDELLNDIVKKVQNHRTYKDEDILNLLICITQGFLTVFSGEPGIGKTSICNILGNVLGLDNIGTHIEQWDGNIIDANRYISVSVERGWTTKRDLIGYYNPLTKTFDQSDKNIYNALKLLSKENKSSKFPMLILLDEANLSSMEYYWADFMALCDGNGDGKICVGDNEILNIPDTLRFVATINNDHTTETLSPRLIDRAWVITLPPCEADKAKKFTPEDYDTVLWENLKDALKSNEDISPRIKTVLDELYSKFAIANMPISPRTDMAIRTYCKIAQKVFKGETASTNAVDFAVSQKMLPKINNYGSSFVRGSNKKTFSEWLNELQSYFDEKNMKRCKDIIERIRNYGEAMDYYKFF